MQQKQGPERTRQEASNKAEIYLCGHGPRVVMKVRPKRWHGGYNEPLEKELGLEAGFKLISAQ